MGENRLERYVLVSPRVVYRAVPIEVCGPSLPHGETKLINCPSERVPLSSRAVFIVGVGLAVAFQWDLPLSSRTVFHNRSRNCHPLEMEAMEAFLLVYRAPSTVNSVRRLLYANVEVPLLC